ncbi:hypothetical protein E2C01_061912 [Portunus trituberculatus]|uniref:Uncharacterized protein n=1 Tax=Portunus trituberculatus TaxID=210409 RepID=A0A5B7HD53_PORTR|nr:hypothetical protein [Portunus trituberculatus]
MAGWVWLIRGALFDNSPVALPVSCLHHVSQSVSSRSGRAAPLGGCVCAMPVGVSVVRLTSGGGRGAVEDMSLDWPSSVCQTLGYTQRGAP